MYLLFEYMFPSSFAFYSSFGVLFFIFVFLVLHWKYQHIRDVPVISDKATGNNHLEEHNFSSLIDYITSREDGNVSVNVIRNLISRDVDINERNEDGFNALMLYCILTHCNLDVINVLVELGIDLGYVNEKGQNVLMVYICRASTRPEIIKALVTSGVDVNYVTRLDNNMTALLYASYQRCSVDVLTTLFDLGAVQSLTRREYFFPLMMYLDYKSMGKIDPEAVKYLISQTCVKKQGTDLHINSLESIRFNVLMRYCCNRVCDVVIVNMLIEAGVDVTHLGEENISALYLYLDKPFDLIPTSPTSFVQCPNPEIVSILVKAGADISRRPFTIPLSFLMLSLIRRHSLEMIQTLVSLGCDPTLVLVHSGGNFYLKRYVKPEVVDKSIDNNVKKKSSRKPKSQKQVFTNFITRMVQSGNNSNVGINVLMLYLCGMDAIPSHVSSGPVDLGIVDYLITLLTKREVDLNMVDSNGRHILINYCSLPHTSVDVIHRLLDVGVDASFTDPRKVNVLMAYVSSAVDFDPVIFDLLLNVMVTPSLTPIESL